MIRIANGQGFWGDWLEAPIRLLRKVPSTTSLSTILRKYDVDSAEAAQSRSEPRLRSRFPAAGRPDLQLLRQRNVRVIANAGGVNPVACAYEVRRLAPDLRIAVVLGDDSLPGVDDMLQSGVRDTKHRYWRALSSDSRSRS